MHLVERSRLVESLLDRPAADLLTTTLLNHLRVRSTTDLAQAQEVVHALEALAQGDGGWPAEALCYLLRCCFTGFRLSMELELLAFLTLNGRLTPAARDMLILQPACSQPQPA